MILDAFIEETYDIPMIGALVLKNGKELEKYLWEPESRINQYSVSKTYTSTAVGMAVDEKRLRIDEPVKKYLEAYWPKEESVDSLTLVRLERLTIRHLLTMTMGHGEAKLMSSDRLALKEKNWVSYALSQPLVHEPGEVFVYNNAGPYLAGVVLQEILGMTLVDYLMPRLFEPLEIIRPTWETDPQGRNFGASGLMLSLSEIARLGQLYLDFGKYGQNELLSAEWVRTATTNAIQDSTRQYGLGLWLGPDDSFRADGKYGQYVIAVPSKKAVIAVNAFNRSQKNIREIIEKTIYPLL